MAERTVWREPETRHYRRYMNPARYPYLVRWGNYRLTTPAKLRTFAGAWMVAQLWRLRRRRNVTISRRESPQ